MTPKPEPTVLACPLPTSPAIRPAPCTLAQPQRPPALSPSTSPGRASASSQPSVRGTPGSTPKQTDHGDALVFCPMLRPGREGHRPPTCPPRTGAAPAPARCCRAGLNLQEDSATSAPGLLGQKPRRREGPSWPRLPVSLGSSLGSAGGPDSGPWAGRTLPCSFVGMLPLVTPGWRQ